MTRPGVFVAIALGVGVLALALSSGGSIARAANSGLQSAPTLLVNDCVEVSVGDRFDVNINARGASSLLAWEVYFAYNRNLLEVISRDVQQLLSTGREANVVDVSDPVPNSTGFYRMGAADLGPGDTPKRGDVLVRLTLQAKAEGVSPSTIYRGDYTGDGVIDFAPILTAAGAQYLGDTNGDTFFDGTISSGQIAIGTGCVQPAPVLQPGESASVPEPPEDSLEEVSGPEPTADPSDEGPGPGSDEGDGGDGDPGEPGDADPNDAGSQDQSSENNVDETSNNDEDAQQTRDPKTPSSGGVGGGLVPWVIIGLGVAVAGAGGITFYMIRAASREPY
jgi:hypothetical protein